MKILNPYIQGNYPQFWVIGSTLACILVSIYCLVNGYTIIFQNLFYIPIILVCILYTRKGFLFSCLLALTYFGLMIGYTHDTSIILQAFIRVILFIGIAGVITFLATAGRESEEIQLHLTEFQNNVISSALVWLMVLDQKGKIVLWNTAAEEISGYHSTEVIGKNDIWKLLYPDKQYRRQITETITRIISEEKYLENFETTIRSKTGTERAISWNTKGIVDQTDKISSYIAIGIDVTDRQIAEKALEHQTKFLQVLIDTLPIPIFYKNLDGVYTGCNTEFEKTTGQERDQVIGKTVFDLWPKELAEVYYKADMSLFTSPHVQQYEAFMNYADKSVHQVMFYKAPIFDDAGQVTGLIGAIMDITNRKRGEEALRESNQKLRLLTSLTRHDIFNQLTVVQLLHNMALDTQEIDKIHGYISRAQQAGEQIEKTIGFTKEYENFGTVSSGWYSLFRTLESTRSDITPGSITIENKIPVRLEIYADPIIRKVFATIIENAIRHGVNVTRISFSCSHEEDTLIIISEDDGIGIPPEEKELIFNHGYGKHTGIGLFLSREILSITGLSIRETGKFGKGARFEILVPEGKFRFMPADIIGNINEN